MLTEVYVPKLGMTQSEITIVELTRSSGDPVVVDDVVVVIETAKVSYEVKSPAGGTIFYLKQVKDKVAIGDTLAVVADTREEFEAYRPAAGPAAGDRADDGALLFEDEEDEGVRLSFEDDEASPTPGRPEASRAAAAAPPPLQAASLAGRRIAQRIPFIGMRRTIANNLVGSLQTGAQLTIVAHTDMTDLNLFRKELVLDYPDTKITLVDLLVKILPVPLKEYPIVNSTIVEDEIVCWDEYNIGVAMALDEGLVVPVVRDADKKGLQRISREIKTLAKKARNKELQPEDYQGGTFTLTSGGKVETDIITPIIKPPESAIVAMGKVAPRPTVYKGELAVRTTSYLCLTHDHRNIDGVPASLFLGRLKEIIETPEIFRKILR